MQDDLVPAEIFNSDEVFRAEMERIVTNTWVFVAHESELPKPGDFVQRKIGLDPVIVTRDGQGGINVLSNYCRCPPEGRAGPMRVGFPSSWRWSAVTERGRGPPIR
jgi:hypothetical protein